MPYPSRPLLGLLPAWIVLIFTLSLIVLAPGSSAEEDNEYPWSKEHNSDAELAADIGEYDDHITRLSIGHDYTEEDDVVIQLVAYRVMPDGSAYTEENVKISIYVGDVKKGQYTNRTLHGNITYRGSKNTHKVNLGRQDLGGNFVSVRFQWFDEIRWRNDSYGVEHSPDPYTIIISQDGKHVWIRARDGDPLTVRIYYDLGGPEKTLEGEYHNVTNEHFVLSPPSNAMSVSVDVEDRWGHTNSEKIEYHVQTYGENLLEKYVNVVMAFVIGIIGALVAWIINKRSKEEEPEHEEDD